MNESVAEPIPLTSPDGVVRAWACPRCYRVRMPAECGQREREAEASRERASVCCLCRDCGRHLPLSWGFCGRCADCEQNERQRIADWQEAQRPERERREAAQEAALSRAHDRDAALRLEHAMSEISEDCWAAGWMAGNEYGLWAIHEGGPREYGMGEVSESDVSELRRLSEKSGGWWRFDDDTYKTFIPLDEWRAHIAAQGSEK